MNRRFECFCGFVASGRGSETVLDAVYEHFRLRHGAPADETSFLWVYKTFKGRELLEEATARP